MKKSAFYDSSIGILKIEYNLSGITSISIVDAYGKNNEKNVTSDFAYNEIKEYLDGNLKEFTFQYNSIGTAFQNKVWKELIKIPYGETRTYKDIAVQVGNPKACRAVGSANNKNPLMIVVPCHRVIGSNNKLVGYAGGLDIKEKLLNLEKSNR